MPYQPHRYNPRQQDTTQNRPDKIWPEPVPADYVDRAEEAMREILGSESCRYITTGMMIDYLTMVMEIYQVEHLRKDETLLTDSVTQLMMLRVRILFDAGRDNNVRQFVERTKLLQYLKGIGSSRNDFIRFAHYMEALVAYHRYFGGRAR